MITYSNTEPQPITIEKRQVRVTWNARQEPVNTLDGEQETQWVYNEAIFDLYDTREVIIRKIIASIHTVEDELALINNQMRNWEINLPEYDEYQDLRDTAKQIADQYLQQRVDTLTE